MEAIANFFLRMAIPAGAKAHLRRLHQPDVSRVPTTPAPVATSHCTGCYQRREESFTSSYTGVRVPSTVG